MALDEASRRRLEELGRRLPQPLPQPQSEQPQPGPKLHRIETETDPTLLFQELMQASPDGTVPPHLLDRLRSLEQQQLRAAATPASSPLKRGSRTGREEPDPLYVSFEQMLLEQEDGEQ